jgi:hypothetical protein
MVNRLRRQRVLSRRYEQLRGLCFYRRHRRNRRDVSDSYSRRLGHRDESIHPVRHRLDRCDERTIIPSIQVACYKGDGTTTDDVAPNAAHSLSTVTLDGNANRFWSISNIQINATDATGCVAGAVMQVTVERAADTATNAEFYGATVTTPRLPVVQAN